MCYNRLALTGLFSTALLFTNMPVMAVEEAATKEGFIDGSTLKLLTRNFYFNRDFRTRGDGVFNSRGQSYREEWAQGFQGFYSSGYTDGAVGLGLDAHALLGVKLDSGGGTSGTNLLPLDSHQRAENDYSTAGGAFKARAFNTEMKVGDLFPITPVFQRGDGRLLPQSFSGVSLQNTSIEGLTLQGGRVHAVRNKASSNHDGEMTTEYGGTTYNSASYYGGDYDFGAGTLVSLYQAEFEDVWRQTYISLSHQFSLSDDKSLGVGANLYRTRDEGEARAGKIDTNSWSAYGNLKIGAHRIMFAYQQIDGDEPFDYLGDGDSIYLANSVLYSDFNSPNEKSWQLRYDYDFAGLGVPGLNFMVRYINGSNIDNSKVDPNGAYSYYSILGDDGKHWERDIEVKYVVQSGSAKNLSFVLQQTVHRSNSAQADGDVNQLRVITQYPIDVM